MSSTDQIVTLFESLSFAEKLSLNERLSTILRKEGGGAAAAGKKRGPKAKADGDKPKRKVALGTLAWLAYVKHIKETQPDALEGFNKEAEKLALIKEIRAQDAEGYNAFVAAWKEEHKDDASQAEASEVSEAEAEEETASVASAPAPAPATVLTAAQKLAAIKAAKAGATATPAKATPATATPVKKAATKTPPAPKKEVKKAKAAPAAAASDEMVMPVLNIAGTDYWHDPGTNFLWLKTGEDTASGCGEEVGYFQPENSEEPIRLAAFGSCE